MVVAGLPKQSNAAMPRGSQPGVRGTGVSSGDLTLSSGVRVVVGYAPRRCAVRAGGKQAGTSAVEMKVTWKADAGRLWPNVWAANWLSQEAGTSWCGVGRHAPVRWRL